MNPFEIKFIKGPLDYFCPKNPTKGLLTYSTNETFM